LDGGVGVTQRRQPYSIAGGPGEDYLSIQSAPEVDDPEHDQQQNRHHQGELHRSGATIPRLTAARQWPVHRLLLSSDLSAWPHDWLERHARPPAQG
jgi:hypothetical protein